MSEKNIKSRIVHKHDIEANWNLATNFYPKKGELIVYDIEIDENDNVLELPEGRNTPFIYERFKIGDGKTSVNLLPFADANKVDKITGKGLSTNDYTTDEKNKLAGIDEGANKTIIDTELSETSENPVQNKTVNAAIASLSNLIGDVSVSEQINSAIEDKADANHVHDAVYLTLVQELPAAAWTSIVYGNGKFVTVASNSNKAAYSTDGINWVIVTLPVTDNWKAITYGGGKFIVIPYYSNNILYSSDGVTWNKTKLSLSLGWRSIACGDGMFVMIAESGSAYAYSLNGQTWVYNDFPMSSNWSDIIYNGNKFVITSENDNVIVVGTNNNWSVHNYTSANGYGMGAIASNGGSNYVSIGNDFGGVTYWTTDGTTWQSVNVDEEWWSDIAYGDGKFVTVSLGNNKAMYSIDGSSWTTASLPTAANWSSVAYGDGKFVAVASMLNMAAVSYDGINWDAYKSCLLDKNGNDVVPQIGEMLSEWVQIYDSGEITSDVNAFSGIDVSGYKHIMVAIKSVNTTKSTGGISGAIIFNGAGGRDYAFKNILPNLIKNTTGTSGGMAIFKITNGFIVCENAMRAQSAENMLSYTEGYGADNLTPVGGGLIACTAPVSSMMVSNANLSNSYYYGVGSRLVVWGCRV